MNNKKQLMESLVNGGDALDGIQLSSSRVGLNRSRLSESTGTKKIITK